MLAIMYGDLCSRADAARNNGLLLCAKTADLIANALEDRQLRVALADSIRCSNAVEQLIIESIDDLDAGDVVALLSESRELEAGIASLRDSLTRAPWVFL